jgi:hypothetical protein
MNQKRLKSSSSLSCYNGWLADIGISRTTGWRWRKAGLISTVSITGRLYLLQEQIEEFARRAAAGEFAEGLNSTNSPTGGFGRMPEHLARSRGLDENNPPSRQRLSRKERN